MHLVVSNSTILHFMPLHSILSYSSCLHPRIDNPEIPEGREQEALQMLKDYVKFVSAVDNPDVKRKLIRELGGKMILIKMLLSVENFSAIIAPVASDRIMTETVNP